VRLAVDAVVPAHNEAGRIGRVVSALGASPCLRSITVVDDGSTDTTATEAEAAGQARVRVLRLQPNRGKGEAMLAAVQSLPRDGSSVAFFDADLVGFQPRHVHKMCALADLGYDMVCGLRDYNAMRNMAQVALGPIITGERILRRWVLERLPLSCWRGYNIEVAMNYTVSHQGGRTALCFLDGVGIVDKLDKTGVVSGLAGQLKMFAQIARTRRALEATHGKVCAI